MRLRIPLFLCLPLLWPTLAAAEGELMVFPATTKVFNSHQQTVKLRNLGDSPLYLSVTLKKVTNPGLTPENKVELGQVAKPGIIATPNRITLGPNQTREVVLKSLFEPGSEELYRLYVVPVKSLSVQDAPTDKISAPMTVSIGYGVLVRHMPAPGNQHTGWIHSCENGGITLKNTGNVRQVLREMRIDGASVPQTLALFPGNPQHFGTKRITLIEDGDDKTQTLDCSR